MLFYFTPSIYSRAEHEKKPDITSAEKASKYSAFQV